MKLTIASAFLVGSAAAFAPTASFSGRSSSLNMAAGTATEGAKVRLDKEQQTVLHDDYPIDTDRLYFLFVYIT